MIVSPYNVELSEQLISFVQRQVRNAGRYAGFERRSEPRHFMVVPVLAVPVDEKFNPIGDCTTVVTRDISSKSIGLVHEQPIGCGLTALHMELAGEEVNVVVEILWHRPLGPFEISGGRFVARLKRFPQRGPHLRTAPAPLPAPS